MPQVTGTDARGGDAAGQARTKEAASMMPSSTGWLQSMVNLSVCFRLEDGFFPTCDGGAVHDSELVRQGRLRGQARGASGGARESVRERERRADRHGVELLPKRPRALVGWSMFCFPTAPFFASLPPPRNSTHYSCKGGVFVQLFVWYFGLVWFVRFVLGPSPTTAAALFQASPACWHAGLRRSITAYRSAVQVMYADELGCSTIQCDTPRHQLSTYPASDPAQVPSSGQNAHGAISY